MFFLNLPESVSAAFADRGIREADIRYTAKADVSGKTNTRKSTWP